MARLFFPGPRIEFLPAFFVLIVIIYAGIVERLDVLFLTAGVGLICSGLKIPLYNTLYFVAIATFLGAFLPFGVPTELVVDERFVPSVTIENFRSTSIEGFSSKKTDEEDEHFDNEDEDEEEEFEDMDDEEGFSNPPGTEKPKKKKVAKKNAPPNNGDRAEMFELGKKYKIPKEGDDEDYHLDAGTTFLNAYKSLNPDQISAMTKDTQDLINTQKQLMNTLTTLKPLITDGKQMMETFQTYFGGSGGAGDMGNLSKMAEKFIAK